MKEVVLREQIKYLKNLFNNIQLTTMQGLKQIETIEKQFSTENEVPTEALLDEIIDNEVENMIKEITKRLDKVYGSKKVVVNMKEVK